jgi:hypothetical protein
MSRPRPLSATPSPVAAHNATLVTLGGRLTESFAHRDAVTGGMQEGARWGSRLVVTDFWS